MWKNHYELLFNSVPNEECAAFVKDTLRDCCWSANDSITPDNVTEALRSLTGQVIRT